MRRIAVLHCAALGLTVALACSTASAAHIVRVTTDHTSIDLGARFEARVDLDRAYDNPFDPSEIRVDALVVTPSGTVHHLPAFWDRDVARSLVDGREVLTASGDGFFHVRYAPMEEGRHELTIVARDAAGQDVSASTSFEVGPGNARGFVHVDPRDPLALSYDDGTPYVPIGANVAWSTAPSAGYDMDEYLSEIAAAGGTWSRLWMTHFGEGWTIEGSARDPSGYYAGLGRYSVEVASRLDRVFEAAEARGIGIQLVLWQHSQFETAAWSSWAQNPYNAANGGPAADSKAFFESPVAIELSQRRIRYLVGRYAAYRSLLAWEIMNEMDGVQAPFKLVSGWCAQRARDLRLEDPYRHLVTTSYLVRPYLGAADAYASDVYDIAQGHAYGGALGVGIPKDAQALRKYGKPLVFGEFGLDFQGDVDLSDPQGVHLAEGSWIALASGYWGGAMSWWWDSYLRPNDLWSTQQGLATFVRKVDLRGMHDALSDSVTAVDAHGRKLDVFGRQGTSGAVLYVRDPEARWEVAVTSGLPHVEGASVSVPCEPGKACETRAYDTATGDELGQAMHVQGGAQSVAWLSLPTFDGSVAVTVRPARAEPDVVSARGGCSVSGWLRSPGEEGCWGVLVVVLGMAGSARLRTKPRLSGVG